MKLSERYMSLQELSNKRIAQGALTNSKRPQTFVEGVYPTHLSRGNGCYVWDYNGKRYVDFITGLGCNLLGYAHEEVNNAIYKRMQNGATLSLSTEEELILAEKLIYLFPFIDCMKFLKTGTEACMAAIKIARAATGRQIVLSEGYHGWADEFVSLTPPALGVPKTALDCSNIGSMQKLQEFDLEFDEREIAAIIIEPVMTDFSKERIEWLKNLRKECTRKGILLIFDEVITGFRFLDYSVSNHLDIIPDIIVMGKSIANGLPLSVVAGKKEIMNCGEYFVSSTFAGETLSLVSASKTIDLLRTKYLLSELWKTGKTWAEEFNSFWPEKIRLEGYPTRGRFEGDPWVKALFFQESCDSGILFGPSWFWNFPLMEKSDITLQTVKDVICKIKMGNVKLRGNPPMSPFADRVRNSKP